MPMMSGSGWFSGPWVFCMCHQWQWPAPMLTRQDGLIVCPLGVDNPARTRTVDRRQRIIQQVLSSVDQEPKLAEILTRVEDNTDMW